MKLLLILGTTAPLLLAGAVPAVAQQATAPPAATSATHTTTDFTTSRNAYLHDAREHMRHWGQRLQAFGAQVHASGEQVADPAAKDLDVAWAKTRNEWHLLQDATASDWAQAKQSFETASLQLRDVWRKIETRQN